MRPTSILLIDCTPAENSGETLEEMLAAAQLSEELHREIVVDPAQLQLEPEWLGLRTSLQPSLTFLILSADQLDRSGALIESIKKQRPELPIIIVAERVSPEATLELLQKGASDFITTPLRVADTLPRVWRLLDCAKNREPAIQMLTENFGMKLLVGSAPNFVAEIKKIPPIAKCDSRVLISGETGTGKEMCARAIHYLSPRSRGPFVPVNCGAIPTDLVENELFGHERGAFTGAISAKAGLIEEAENGTLFLDEIDCLPAMAQVKLLRFLQEREYRRLGSAKTRHADVRVVAASNTPFEEAVRTGRVRQDLYYRLNVFSLSLPPLKERKEDIPMLADHFVAKYAPNRQMTISAGGLQKLTFYDWPGNVRELEHTIERAVMFCEDSLIHPAHLSLPCDGSPQAGESFQQTKARVVAQFERDYIQKLLALNDGNIARAAAAARKNRRAFWELIRKHKMTPRTFKTNS